MERFSQVDQSAADFTSPMTRSTLPRRDFLGRLFALGAVAAGASVVEGCEPQRPNKLYEGISLREVAPEFETKLVILGEKWDVSSLSVENTQDGQDPGTTFWKVRILAAHDVDQKGTDKKSSAPEAKLEGICSKVLTVQFTDRAGKVTSETTYRSLYIERKDDQNDASPSSSPK